VFNIFVAIVLIAAVLAFVLALVGFVLSRFYRKVPQGQALILNKMNDRLDVTFTGATALPVIHKAEVMEIGVRVLEVSKDGNDGLICKDNIRADIKVSFYIRVNPVKEDVLKVAKLLGVANASNNEALYSLFSAKFAEALKTAGKQLEFVELYEKRDLFRANVIKVVGEDLNGFVLDDVAIEYLEQTPMNQLDPNNVLDAEGIRKITMITTVQAIETNVHKREAEKQMKAKDVETQQALFEMERQEKAAEFRANREMATAKAREDSQIALVEAEERLKSETARLRTDEQVRVQFENVQREVEVATKNRERVLAIETEKIEKARQLEVVNRNIETLAASKELEAEKGRVAELAKGRIAAEKTVAEQEESIKTMRMVEEAQRNKEATVILASADAAAKLSLAEADAASEAKRGEGAGLAIQARLKGEAAGLRDKAEAMKQLEGVGKEYDLAVRNIDANTQVRLAAVEAQRETAIKQSEAMASALQSANINIVGGADMFVDRLMTANAAGQSLNAFAESSPAAKTISGPYISGEKDLVELLAGAVGGLGAAGLANLSLARVLSVAADRLGGDDADRLRKAIGQLDAEGVGEMSVGKLLGSSAK
jgi:uncharacterized membrane protein YqiK